MTTASHKLLAALLSAGLTAGLAAQGELIYYKFDSADGKTVLNHGRNRVAGTENGAGPMFGGAGLQRPGAHGTRTALASSIFGVAANSVNTGFKGAIQGDLTIAFALQNKWAMTAEVLNGLVGRPDFYLSSGGVAGPGFTLYGWGGQDLVLKPATPVHQLSGWNHFAIVLDGSARKATLYVNGRSAVSSNLTTAVNIQANATALHVGRDWITHCGGYYHMDEVRVYNRAATPAEVAQWAKATTPVATTFGQVETPLGQDLVAVGDPSWGNTSFQVGVSGQASTPFGFVLGLSKLAQPIDAGTLFGGHGHVLMSMDVVVFGFTSAGGTGVVPLPIPPGKGCVEVYAQAATLAKDNRLSMSRGLVISVDAIE